MAKKGLVPVDKPLPRLYATTTVSPDAYNIREQMIHMIELANKDYAPMLEIDVGKVIGLYQAYLELKMSKKTKEARAAKQQRQLEQFGGKRTFVCPQCDRPRMTRPHGHTVSLEKKTYDTYSGGTIELFADICPSCIAKNKTKHFEPSEADLKKVLKAMQESKLEEGVSLEEML